MKRNNNKFMFRYHTHKHFHLDFVLSIVIIDGKSNIKREKKKVREKIEKILEMKWI